MSWRVEVAPGAQRSLHRLPHKVGSAIVEFSTATLPTNPERMSKPLRYDLEGLSSARRGDYRMLIELNFDTEVHLPLATLRPESTCPASSAKNRCPNSGSSR